MQQYLLHSRNGLKIDCVYCLLMCAVQMLTVHTCIAFCIAFQRISCCYRVALINTRPPHTHTHTVYTLAPDPTLPRNSTCESPDQEDFTYAHHLTTLHGDDTQSNEIVIPRRQQYSWSNTMPSSSIERNTRSNSAANRGYTVAIDMSQLGGNTSVEVSVGGEHGDTSVEPPETD